MASDSPRRMHLCGLCGSTVFRIKRTRGPDIAKRCVEQRGVLADLCLRSTHAAQVLAAITTHHVIQPPPAPLRDDLVFQHGEVDGVAGERRVEVAFDAAAHAFEEDQVRIGGGAVEVGRDFHQVDQRLAGAGGDARDRQIGERWLGVTNARPPGVHIIVVSPGVVVVKY
jgi:hypothetical protein